MTWLNQRWVAFDTETTGVDPHACRIVSAHVALIGGGEPTLSHSFLIDPGVPIPAGAARIHGITTDHARAHGRPPGEALDLIAGHLALAMHHGQPVVGWNLAYDATLLEAELTRHQLPTVADRLDRPWGPVLDGYVLDKKADRYRKGSRKLIDAARHYGVDLAEADAHGAAADAMAAARVVWKLARQHPDLADLDLTTLHARQIEWRAEQCASLQAYFRRTRPDAVVDGRWPVQPLPDGWDPAHHPTEAEEAA